VIGEKPGYVERTEGRRGDLKDGYLMATLKEHPMLYNRHNGILTSLPDIGMVQGFHVRSFAAASLNGRCCLLLEFASFWKSSPILSLCDLRLSGSIQTEARESGQGALREQNGDGSSVTTPSF
jgi:hypothetical protein